MEKLFRLPPPIIAFMLLILTYGLQKLVSGLPLMPHPVTGALLMGSGAVLATSAVGDFFRRKTTFLPHGQPSTLVVEGPYSWTRNPMYLGLFTVTLGIALYLGSFLMLLAPIAFGYIVGRVHVQYEEGTLVGLFGEKYERYRQRVARWL